MKPSYPGRDSSPEADPLVAKALSIIDDNVNFESGLTAINSAGLGGRIMEAATLLKNAHQLHPDDPKLHFGYASCLSAALQWPDARIEMERLARSHPDFEFASIALRGWDLWQSVLTLPKFPTDKRLPSRVGRVLPPSSSGLFAFRDGLVPVSVVCFRDSDTFTDRGALENARIDLTTVISQVNSPQVVGLYVRVYDNPRSPFTIEVAHTPFFPRGHETRNVWEYFSVQPEISLLVADSRDDIFFNRKLALPERMLKTNAQLNEMFRKSTGGEISQGQFLSGVQRHQGILPTDFQF